MLLGAWEILVRSGILSADWFPPPTRIVGAHWDNDVGSNSGSAYVFEFVSALATYWRHDPAAPGDWFDANNWTDGVPADVAGAYVDNGGAAEIAGASADADANALYVGYGDAGAVWQHARTLTVAGDTYRLESGSVVLIPPHAPHSGKSVTACRILDVFHPVREDLK